MGTTVQELPNRRCEALNTAGRRCMKAATQYWIYDGQEYLACALHADLDKFRPCRPKKATEAPPTPCTYSYLRVSTPDQNTEKNKADVLAFANDRRFGSVEFVEDTASGKKPWRERKVGPLVERLQKGDRLIVPELTRLGRSTLEVLEILKVAKEKGVAVYSVKERLELNGDDLTSKVLATLLSLFSELERDFISLRTKEALKARKAAGVKLGRPKGPGKSKLDPFRPEIEALLANGSTQKFIADRYGVTPATLHLWLKKRKINAQPKP